MTIATYEAVQMLMAGWTVRYHSSDYEPWNDRILWRSPDGCSGSNFFSEFLDDPPAEALRIARERGDIKDRPRIPAVHLRAGDRR